MIKQVWIATDLWEAYAVRGRLWAAGIHAIIRGRDLSAMRELQQRQDAQPSVWVDAADGERAQHVLGNNS